MIRQIAVALATAVFLLPIFARAQSQGVIDPGRVQERLQELPQPSGVVAPREAPGTPELRAPEGSETITLTLREITLEGVTAYKEIELRDIYAPYLDRSITLDTLWLIAQKMTERYHADGYFLTRAYVPAQEVDGGRITIRVLEGYIGSVVLDERAQSNRLVVAMAEELKAQRPVTTQQIESTLMRMNDIPGMVFRNVLEKEKGTEDTGAVILNVVSMDAPSSTQISVDNYGSRFLGPYEGMISHRRSVIDNHETEISLLGASQIEELRYGSLTHRWMFLPDLTLDVHGSKTKSEPGFTLAEQEIDSDSVGYGFGVTYQWLRQRQENLSFRFGFDGRDTESDIFGGLLPLTRDHVRAARVMARYETADRWRGYNLMVLTVSKGLEGFGSSKSGDANLSRAAAAPDFTKGELTLSRLQAIDNNWNILGSFSGQVASDPLFSSEEFGYGGQAFGRAYDSSEITGDQGVAAALEIRYNGVPEWAGFSASPYGFYDIGAIWNDDAGQKEQVSGSSAGLGVRVSHTIGLAANLGIALPLTRSVDAPLYDANGKNPRYMMQLSYGF